MAIPSEEGNLFIRTHRPTSILALVGVTVVFLLATPARAAIILADIEAGDGVLACLEQCVYAPATENPAKAFNGAVESAMSQNGSFISFSFTLSGGNQLASTGNPTPLAHSILIAILGTAGEPVGTPVSLRLNNLVTPDPGPDVTIINFLNNTEYGVNTDVGINGLKVGDSFGYWLYIATATLGNTAYTYSVDLSVKETEIPPIPEPGTLALLMTAGLALRVVLLRRRGRSEFLFRVRRKRPLLAAVSTGQCNTL
jgi:hypothetical protein